MNFLRRNPFFAAVAISIASSVPALAQECVDPGVTFTGFYEDHSPRLTIPNPCVAGLGMAREYRFENSAWGSCPQCSTTDCSADCATNWPGASKTDNTCTSSCPTGGMTGIEYCCDNSDDPNEYNVMQICNKNSFPIWITTKGGNNEYVWESLPGDTCRRVDGNGGPSVGTSGPALSHVNICVTECDGDDGPGMNGDPHIKSWSGEWYDYHGECDLKLAHVSGFDDKQQDLDVHVRTTIINEYSYMEAAAIKIGDDVLEVAGWGEYALNGVDDALLDTDQDTSLLRKVQTVSTIGGYPVYHTIVDNTNRKKNIFDIVLSERENITITNFKRMVNVNFVSPTRARFQHVEGILGNYHGKMVARDGVTDLSQDINAFGQEWQITDQEPMLFRDARVPQYPAPCHLPSESQQAARRRRRLGEGGVDEEAAEIACSHLQKNQQAFDACVYDVRALNDLSVADGGVY